MVYKNSKYLRILLQFLFFCIYIVVLSGFFSLPSFLSFISKIQLFPALIKSFKLILPSIFIVFFELLLAFIFGRFYCSSICPLGALQDSIGFIAGKVRSVFHLTAKTKKNVRLYPMFLRLLVLLTAFVSVFLGYAFFAGLFEPYSIFGKIVSLFNQPFFGISILKIFLVNCSILVIFTLISKKGTRLYCSSLCPVGTILGLIYTRSLYKPAIDENLCTQCGKCSAICKGECIDYKQYKIHCSQCVLCFDCMVTCPVDAIKISKSIHKKNLSDSKNQTHSRAEMEIYVMNSIPDKPDKYENHEKNKANDMYDNHDKHEKYKNRRKFLSQFSGALLYFLMLSHIPIRFMKPTENAIPPGAKNINALKMYCIQCSLCARVCPTNVIMIGNQTPYLDYNKGYCLYECTLCNQYCPTSALNPLSLDEKQTVQLGKVNLLKEKCLVYRDDKHCGACAEQCPTQAVYMIPHKGILYGPETNQKICVGCGACQYVCPAQPEKAISVDVYSRHKKREKIETKPLSPEEKEIDSEFPF